MLYFFFCRVVLAVLRNSCTKLYKEMYYVKCEYLQMALEKGNLNFNPSPCKEIQSNRFSNT